MNNPIQYCIFFPDGQALNGSSSRIEVRDNQMVLSIDNNHAPLISLLENGNLTIYDTGIVSKEIPYHQGFLRFFKNTCNISILS